MYICTHAYAYTVYTHMCAYACMCVFVCECVCIEWNKMNEWMSYVNLIVSDVKSSL